MLVIPVSVIPSFILLTVTAYKTSFFIYHISHVTLSLPASTVINRELTMWLVVLAYLLVLLVSVKAISHYIPLFSYSFYFYIPLTLSIFIPLQTLILLPLDHVSNNYEPIAWFCLLNDVIALLWKLSYYSLLCLSFIILPLLQEYFNSGSFNGKLRDSFKSNLNYNLILLSITLLSSIFLFFKGFSLKNLNLLIIALSHTYSLSLSLFLMSHGIVAIPRKLFTLFEFTTRWLGPRGIGSGRIGFNGAELTGSDGRNPPLGEISGGAFSVSDLNGFNGVGSYKGLNPTSGAFSDLNEGFQSYPGDLPWNGSDPLQSFLSDPELQRGNHPGPDSNLRNSLGYNSLNDSSSSFPSLFNLYPALPPLYDNLSDYKISFNDDCVIIVKLKKLFLSDERRFNDYNDDEADGVNEGNNIGGRNSSNQFGEFSDFLNSDNGNSTITDNKNVPPSFFSKFKDNKISDAIKSKLGSNSNEESVDITYSNEFPVYFRDWILSLYNQIPDTILNTIDDEYIANNSSQKITKDQLTEKFMVKLTKSFQNNRRKLTAYEAEFDDLFSKIIKLEDVLNGKNSGKINFRFNHTIILNDRFTILYYYYINPLSKKFFSMILFTLSFIIIESEFFHSTKLSIINIIMNKFHNHNVIQFFITEIFFSFMLISALTSLTSLKIFNMYHLVKNGSDPVSCSWYAMYISRLTIPLSYNFITLFQSPKSVFEEWFGKSIHLSGIFEMLNSWLPRLILIPVILTTFNIYDKVKKRLGINDSWGFEDDEESGYGNSNNLIIAEAKRIINREIGKRNIDRRENTFNLNNAANLNYENNRNNFNTSLRGNAENVETSTFSDNNNEQEGIWNKINGTLNNIKNSVTDRLRPYRDDPLDFNYDDDADQNLVI